MKKRGEKRAKNFKIIVVSAVLLILFVLIFLIGYFNWDKISGRVVDVDISGEESVAGGVSQTAVVKPVDGVSLSVATLKDSYKVGEKILLTDPPDEVLISSVSRQRIYPKNIIKTENEGMDSNNYYNSQNDKAIDLKYKGYIIEFVDKPLVLKEKELAPAGVAGLSASAKTKIKTSMASYKTQIRTKRETIKNNIKTALGKTSIKTITENAVANSNPDELKILGEYENVFNGIALDITSEEAEKIKKISGIKSVSPNLMVNAILMDSVPLIGADKVWELDKDGNNCASSGKECLTGKNITIAIIDTGVDYTHGDLGGCFGPNCKVVGGYDFVNNDDNPMDDHGHGTHCAGIAAGSGAGGLKGVAPDAKLYAYKVLDSQGSGYWNAIMSAIERAVDPNKDEDFSDKADVISMSLGTQDYYWCYNDALSISIINAINLGVVTVIAAGNEGDKGKNTITYPACIEEVISIGSVAKGDPLSKISSFSSRGFGLYNDQPIFKPDLTAPGENICSAEYDSAWNWLKCFDNKHVAISGTSMATPHVAGAVALIKQAFPSLTSKDIKSLLVNHAKENVYFTKMASGAGSVDVLNSINSYRENKIIINPSSISFGIVDLSKDIWTNSKNLEIINSEEINVLLDISVEGTFPKGISFEYPKNILTNPGKENNLNFLIRVDKNTDYGYYEGNLVFNFSSGLIKVPFFLKKLKIDLKLDKKLTNTDIKFNIFSEVPLYSINAYVIRPDLKQEKIIYLMSSDSQNYQGKYFPSIDGDYKIKIEAKDSIGITLYGEESFVVDLTKPQIELNFDKKNNNINLQSNENINARIGLADKINDQFVLSSSIGIDKNDEIYLNIVKMTGGGFYTNFFLFDQHYNSKDSEKMVVDGSKLFENITKEDPSRYWGTSLWIEDSWIFFDSNNQRYSLFKIETNNGFCGIDRLVLRKFDNNSRTWKTVNDNLLNVNHCTDDKVMCQNPSSYHNQWCDYRNGKFNNYIRNPHIILDNDNNFNIFWEEGVSMTQYFNINGFFYDYFYYNVLDNSNVSIINLNTFYKKVDKNGRTLVDKTSIGSVEETFSTVIDTIIKDKNNKIYIFLDKKGVEINKNNSDSWIFERKNDVNYKILDLETGIFSNLKDLDTDGYDFSVAVDKFNNFHVVYTNTTVFKGDLYSRYGQLYYGIINFSTLKIDKIMEIKPSGWGNYQNKISINDFGNILIVHQEPREDGWLYLKYWLYDPIKNLWINGEWGKEGYILEIWDFVINSYNSIYSFYLGDSQKGWHSVYDFYIKPYIVSPVVQMTNQELKEIVYMDGQDKNWSGKANLDINRGIVESWAIDEAGNVAYKNQISRPQSKLVNNNSKIVKGILYMYLQKKNNKGKWVTEKTVVRKWVTIPAKGLVKLDIGKDNKGKQVFSGWNNLKVFAKSKGDYRVRVAFVVGSKKTESNWEFKVA